MGWTAGYLAVSYDEDGLPRWTVEKGDRSCVTVELIARDLPRSTRSSSSDVGDRSVPEDHIRILAAPTKDSREQDSTVDSEVGTTVALVDGNAPANEDVDTVREGTRNLANL